VPVPRFADALVVGTDLTAAAETATRQALEQLDGPATIVFAFVSADDPEAVGFAGRHVATIAAPAPVIGCSARGLMAAGGAVERRSGVAVFAGSVPDIRLRSFHLEVMRTPEGMAVVGMPTLRAGDDGMVLFADPHSFPIDGFVERSNDSLDGIPMIGGLATGAQGPGSTRLFVNGQAVDRGAVGVLLGGGVRTRPLVSQGCRPVGPTMIVTRAEDNVVLELAGVPAVTKLEQILADLSPLDQALATHGLHFGIAMDEYADEHEHGDFLVRSVMSVDHARDGLIVGGLVQVGRTVRFQVRDADTADADLQRAVQELRKEPGFSRIDGALLVSCNGRGEALFGRSDHDVNALREWAEVPAVAGFFAGGEIGPVGGRNFLHGFTASVLAFAG
jgi:small ligand-binding sensory domain FIST